MFWTYTMMNTSENAFNISDHDMNPGQVFKRFLRIIYSNWCMMITFLSKKIIGFEFVGFNTALRSNIGINKFFNRILGYTICNLHFKVGRFASALDQAGSNRNQNGLFPSRSAGNLSTHISFAKVALIKFNQAGQFRGLVTFLHRFVDLMSHGPNRFITLHFQQTHDIQQRSSRFITRNQINHPEPFFQGRSCLMKNSPGGNRSLVLASFALKKPSG